MIPAMDLLLLMPSKTCLSVSHLGTHFVVKFPEKGRLDPVRELVEICDLEASDLSAVVGLAEAVIVTVEGGVGVGVGAVEVVVDVGVSLMMARSRRK
jgi:hypothetical protein